MGIVRCDSGSEGERAGSRTLPGVVEFNGPGSSLLGNKLDGSDGVGRPDIVNFDKLIV